MPPSDVARYSVVGTLPDEGFKEVYRAVMSFQRSGKLAVLRAAATVDSQKAGRVVGMSSLKLHAELCGADGLLVWPVLPFLTHVTQSARSAMGTWRAS